MIVPPIVVSATRIVCEPSVSDEVKAAVLPILERWQHLIPTWCHVLYVRFDATNGEDDMGCSARMEYRWGRLWVYPLWLQCRAEEREAQVVHELIHLLMEPMSNHAQDLLDLIEEKFPDAHRFAKEQQRYANESATVDLCRAFGVMPPRAADDPPTENADAA